MRKITRRAKILFLFLLSTSCLVYGMHDMTGSQETPDLNAFGFLYGMPAVSQQLVLQSSQSDSTIQPILQTIAADAQRREQGLAAEPPQKKRRIQEQNTSNEIQKTPQEHVLSIIPGLYGCTAFTSGGASLVRTLVTRIMSLDDLMSTNASSPLTVILKIANDNRQPITVEHIQRISQRFPNIRELDLSGAPFKRSQFFKTGTSTTCC